MQNSQENNCVRVSFLIKGTFFYKGFPMNFAKFLRTTFLQNTSGGCFWKIVTKIAFINPFHTTTLFLYLPKKHQKTCDFLVFSGDIGREKQPSVGAFMKICCGNMLQIYRRTTMRKSDLLNFIEITFRYGCSTVNLLHIFRTPFYKNIYGRLLLKRSLA